MFVTTQSFRNVDSGPGGALPLEERFGLTMKHAGVTISITTLTSFIAFAIGATTVREGIINIFVFVHSFKLISEGIVTVDSV